MLSILIDGEMPDVSLICRKYQKGVIHVVILKQTDSDTFRSMSSMNYAASIERKKRKYIQKAFYKTMLTRNAWHRARFRLAKTPEPLSYYHLPQMSAY